MSHRAPRRLGVEINPHIVGGGESFLHALFTHLDRRLFVPVAFAAAPGPWQDYFGGCAETHSIGYITAAGSAADVAAQLQRLDLDLVQSSYFSPATAAAAARAGIPHVWRIGGHVDALERDWTQRDKDQLLTIMKLTSRRIVCASQFLRSQFDRVGCDGIDVIRNGVDLSAFPAPAGGRNDAPPSAAMIAHLLPQKRHAVFLRAAAEVARALPHTRFFIFGGSHPAADLRAYEESLRALARDLGIAAAVEFRHLRAERFAVIAGIDVIALPGVNEGSSNAIIESMALGKAVIAARSGGNGELIDDRVTGLLVEPDDPSALARALIDLLTDAGRRTAMGEAGRQRAERDLDIRRCARAYEAFYGDVLAPQARAR